MSELAIVSARPARLKVAAEKGKSGAKKALELASDPGKFLSTVQIGITLVSIFAGAYSGASLGGPTAERFSAWGMPARYADDAGFAALGIEPTCRAESLSVDDYIRIANSLK